MENCSQLVTDPVTIDKTSKSLIHPTTLLPSKSYDVSIKQTIVEPKISIVDDPIIRFYNNPFENEIDIVIDSNSNHSTHGFDITSCDKMDHVKLLACHRGTLAGSIPKWRSILRNVYILKINNIPTKTIKDVRTQFSITLSTLKIKFGMMEK